MYYHNGDMNLTSVSLDILRAFVVFVESPNITKAAESLKISQPLLTKHLQTLEDQSNEPVFLFEGRKKICTRYGVKLYEVIKSNFGNLQRDLEKLEIALSNPASVRLRIGSRKEILEKIASHLSFPGRMELLPMAGAQVVTELENGRLEIGISRHKIDSLSIVRKTFLSDQFNIAIPKSWRLTSYKFPNLLFELEEKPRLSYGPSDPTTPLLEYYEIEDFPEPHFTFSSWTAITDLIEKGKGWSIVPSLQATENAAYHIIQIPEKVLDRTQFYLYYPKELAHHSWFQDVIKSILTT